MRIDVPRRKQARTRAPLWLVALPMVGMLLVGIATPLLSADTFDQFMKSRGWRDGESRSVALEAWLHSFGKPPPELPLMRFDVRFKHYKKLLDKRATALKTGRLDSSNADFIPGRLRHGGKELVVKLRLQGDDVDAIRGQQWPLRVRIRGGDHALGIERFTLRPPLLDGFYDKAIAYNSLRGLTLVPRYRFVRVVINGKSLGVMGMEEYLSNELVEANGRPPGPILRIDHTSVLPSGATETEAASRIAQLANLRNATGQVMRAGRWSKTPKRQRTAQRAKVLLNGFLAGRRGASATFAPKTTAHFLAAVEAVGAAQLLRWDNLRWYYNPVIDRLEPIAYAADAVLRSDELGLVRQSPVSERILRDPAIIVHFRNAPLRQLNIQAGRQLLQEHPMAAVTADAWITRRKLVRRTIRRLTAKAASIAAGQTRSLDDAMRTRRTWSVGPGVVNLDRAVRLPHGVTMVIAAGTTLKFSPGASLFVDGGDTFLHGTAKRPIKLLFTGARNDDGRRRLLLRGGRVILRHVVVEEDAAPALKQPAAFNIYGSHVDIVALTVKTSSGAAALQLLRSRGRVRDLQISSCAGDGLSLDHAYDLHISNTRIANCKGDGIDVHGGRQLRLESIEVQAFGDKAVSIGAAAELTIKGLRTRDGMVGLAVKDGSQVSLTTMHADRLSGSILAVFNKKIRFGAPNLKVTGIVVANGTKARFVSHGEAALSVDGQRIKSTPGSLDQLYKLGWLGSP